MWYLVSWKPYFANVEGVDGGQRTCCGSQRFRGLVYPYWQRVKDKAEKMLVAYIDSSLTGVHSCVAHVPLVS